MYKKILILVFLSFAAYSNTLDNSLMWDDDVLIKDNPGIKNFDKIPELFKSKYWEKFAYSPFGRYRPLRDTLFAMEYHFFNIRPFGYHLTNLLLHGLCVVLIYYLGLLVLKENAAAFLSAILFAVHPIHTESVAWVKNRSDILCCIFYLLSFIFFIKNTELTRNLNTEQTRKVILRAKPEESQRRDASLSFSMTSSYFLLLTSCFCFILALLSKEMAVTLPVVLIGYCFILTENDIKKSTIIKTVLFWIILFIYIILKIKTAILAEPSSISIVTKTFADYLKMLIFPYDFNADRILLPLNFFDVFLIFVFFLMIIIFINRSNKLLFGLLWIFLTLLPVLNIFYLEGRPIAEQRLYIPSVGFTFLLGIIFAKMNEAKHEKTKHIVQFSFLMLVVSYFFITLYRNDDWQNGLKFWTKTVKASPYSIRAKNNLAATYLTMGNYDKAIPLYEEVIKLSPEMTEAIEALGIIYAKTGKFGLAEEKFRKIIQLNPDSSVSYNHIGNIKLAKGFLESAEVAFKKAIELDPQYADAHYNLANLYIKKNLINLAIKEYETALALKPEMVEALFNLALTYEKINQDKSIELYKRYLKLAKNIPEQKTWIPIVRKKISEGIQK